MRVALRAFVLSAILFWMFWTWVYARSGLRWLFWAVTGRRSRYERLGNERIVRLAFEALGPTFIKLGQLVASSPGIFPKRYSDEFQKCLDAVKPFDVRRLKAVAAVELGEPVETAFAQFEEAPLGSASIAQVHGAVLKSGESVVIKVQRPGIRRKVDADIWWMIRGAWVCEKLFEGARLANVSGLIDDFNRTIHEELDFRLEADNLMTFNGLMKRYSITDVVAPKPAMEMVTEKVLVMERFYGFKADDIEAIKASGIDSEAYLKAGLRAWMMTMMLDGFFHGDAHAGNLMLLPDRPAEQGGPAIGMLDFGIIGRFSDLQRHQVMRYVLAFTALEFECLAEVMLEIGALKLGGKGKGKGKGFDKAELVADLERVYSPLVTKNMAEIKYEEILPDINKLAYKYGITLPSEFLLILKQLLYFDRYAKLTAPNLNVLGDLGLVDFLFTPIATQSGLDFNVLMPLLMKIQVKYQAQQAADDDRAGSEG